jgi:tetratricopeptide (TPR) repeat protein
MGLFSFFRRDPAKEKAKKFRELEVMFEDDSEIINNLKVSWLTERGNAFGMRNKFDLAIADFEAAIDLKSDCLPAYFGMALAYYQKGDRPRAMEILKNAPEQMRLHGQVALVKERMLAEWRE